MYMYMYFYMFQVVYGQKIFSDLAEMFYGLLEKHSLYKHYLGVLNIQHLPRHERYVHVCIHVHTCIFIYVLLRIVRRTRAVYFLCRE